MTAEMRSIENTLALWMAGLLTSDQVIQWAWGEIARLDEPSQELFDLASDGPQRCLKRASNEFSARPTQLSYIQEFSLRALATLLDSDDSVLQFAEWASRYAMGEDLSQPFVSFGYQLHHLLYDCQDRASAKALVRNKLPSVLPTAKAVAARFHEAA